ncbi:hypothetical protein [Streptomyces sp. MNU76]|nr:hypothetical protein [Streptomyces sp. MNU76]
MRFVRFVRSGGSSGFVSGVGFVSGAEFVAGAGFARTGVARW